MTTIKHMWMMKNQIDYSEVPARERDTLSVVAFVHDQLITKQMSASEARETYTEIVKYAGRHGFKMRGDPSPMGEIMSTKSFAHWLGKLRGVIEDHERWERQREAVPTENDFHRAWIDIHTQD
jgi:hypothetical protein